MLGLHFNTFKKFNVCKLYANAKNKKGFQLPETLTIVGGSYWVRTSDPPVLRRDALNQLCFFKILENKKGFQKTETLVWELLGSNQ